MMFFKYLKRQGKVRGMELEDVTSHGVKNEYDEVISLGEPIADSGLRFFSYLILFIFLLLGARVFFLQVVKGDYYAELARENKIRNVVVKAPRGLIFDRMGRPLVQNVPSFDVILIPADLPKNIDERRKETRKLAGILSVNDQSLEALIESQNFESLNPVLIKENITADESLVFSENKMELSGFQLDKTAVRNYENGAYFSSIMGYTGKIDEDELTQDSDYLMTDYIGKTGLEYSYEKYLRGINGKQKAEVDSAGNIKKNLGVEQPVNGNDLYLGIDEELQRKIQDTLQKKMEETETKTAAAVAIDPRNGEILSLVNLPSYDNNLFAKGISQDDYKKLITDPDKPMFNRAISGEYPPGSTFKPLMASAALQEKIITPQTTVDCHGAIHIGSYNFPDWKTHGVTEVKKAIAESCDVFFYSVGGGFEGIEGIGIDRVKKYADLFGLGRTIGVDIPGEARGLVPNQAWKQDKLGERWYIGDDYHCAIGQGFITATPLQLANYTAAIANGGTVYKPHLVSSIKKRDGTEEKNNPEVISKNFISPSNLEVVREGMRETVASSSGSAQQLADLPVAVAGKTGTAQFGEEDKTHGWFVSFAPFENPRIAMAVLMEGGGEGHSTAVPVSKDVYKWYFGEHEEK